MPICDSSDAQSLVANAVKEGPLGVNGINIIKLKNMQQASVNQNERRCRAIALMTTGENIDINYRFYFDGDDIIVEVRGFDGIQ